MTSAGVASTGGPISASAAAISTSLDNILPGWQPRAPRILPAEIAEMLQRALAQLSVLDPPVLVDILSTLFVLISTPLRKLQHTSVEAWYTTKQLVRRPPLGFLEFLVAAGV